MPSRSFQLTLSNIVALYSAVLFPSWSSPVPSPTPSVCTCQRTMPLDRNAMDLSLTLIAIKPHLPSLFRSTTSRAPA